MSTGDILALIGIGFVAVSAIVGIPLWLGKELRTIWRAIAERQLQAETARQAISKEIEASRHKAVSDITAQVLHIDERISDQIRDLEQRLYRDIAIAKELREFREEVRRGPARRGAD